MKHLALYPSLAPGVRRSAVLYGEAQRHAKLKLVRESGLAGAESVLPWLSLGEKSIDLDEHVVNVRLCKFEFK